MKKGKKKIFLIEDDPDIIDVYTTAFKNAYINVETISWGREAIKRIKNIKEGKEKKPDLVIIDLILPDINGIEVLKEIKGDGKTKDIPVFVLSNYTSAELQKKSDISPEKFILKTSITPTQLVGLVEKQIKRSEKPCH